MKRQVVIVEQDGNFEELTVTLQKEEWDDDENIGATE
jgi:segregation and condensation protein A